LEHLRPVGLGNFDRAIRALRVDDDDLVSPPADRFEAAWKVLLFIPRGNQNGKGYVAWAVGFHPFRMLVRIFDDESATHAPVGGDA
jgi:hypothetical protein